MKILHIVNYLSDRGNGIANVVVDLATAQADAGHQVAVASGGGEYIQLLREGNVEDRLITPLYRGSVFRAISSLNTQVANFQPDILHSHTRAGTAIGWLIAKWRGLPHVAHLHNVHDSALWMFRLADRVIAVSAAVKEHASRNIDRKRIVVVLNGTIGSPRVPRINQLIPRSLEHPAIVTVAGMNHRKGIAELLVAFETLAAVHTSLHLYLVGDGPERTLFELQAAQSLYRDRIHFEGYRQIPQEYMLAADVFVLASRRDSLGLVLLEAREAGCAIVATAVDGIPEALSSGTAGILVSPSDPSELTAAVDLLLRNDTTRQMWKRRALENCHQFTCTYMAEQVLKSYNDLV